MLIEEKYFPLDKNYLLKSVQAFAKDTLLDNWISEILRAYTFQHNPMGLVDDFILELQEKIRSTKTLIDENYDVLAAIYRHDHSDNQLEIMWDGRSHMEAYDSDWKEMFAKWTKDLSLIKEVQRPIIKFAVSEDGVNHQFLKQGIRRAILAHFNLRIKAHTLYRISA